jgi:uracil-DNA glycosylase
LETFPFGMPVEPVVQQDRGPKRVFVLGVYASAVHARWVDDHGRTVISALAVASEPEIFWRDDGAEDIVARVHVPAGMGRLVPASERLNGPSGRALDDLFLGPLGLGRSDAWLCDLLPFSRRNARQTAALACSYDPWISEPGLPAYNWPPVPRQPATPARREAIRREMEEASAEILITLGDQSLKWFASQYGTRSCLTHYGVSHDEYGRLHSTKIDGRRLSLLPLVHPRQAGALGTHSSRWAELHRHWVAHTARGLLRSP